MANKLIKYINFEIKGDDRGSLISIEQNSNIPFEIKRNYYIFNTLPGVKRGCHAHKKLKQLLITVSGKCDILLDNGIIQETAVLNSPNKGLLIEEMIWREMFNFTKDCVLLVLANDYYSEHDYIRNYHEFLILTKKNQ